MATYPTNMETNTNYITFKKCSKFGFDFFKETNLWRKMLNIHKYIICQNEELKIN
jgi:hypothetical protein